ncbi:hypothetical protein F511_47011 [Dorcoceras hygrometricum]|uniref:Uncharacterized protein n=1 Tax=Dorcoceras hygrometricum TaxID=472368 RepID=A0A2Z6ZS34_9LAMI|nr:hypothetical protein F511_47011 [Dorcoceras hygrometricum]
MLRVGRGYAPMVALLRCARWRWTRDGARALLRRRARFLVGGGRRSAAAPAILRRISDDVVTAGLNSFRV